MFPDGVLTLLSTTGPVVWNRTPSHGLENRMPLFTLICDGETRTVAELGEQRMRANVEALNAMRKSIMGLGVPAIQEPQHILQVSKAWESIGRKLYSA